MECGETSCVALVDSMAVLIVTARYVLRSVIRSPLGRLGQTFMFSLPSFCCIVEQAVAEGIGNTVMFEMLPREYFFSGGGGRCSILDLTIDTLVVMIEHLFCVTD